MKYTTNSIPIKRKKEIQVTESGPWLIALLVLSFSLLTAASAFAQDHQGQPDEDAITPYVAQAAPNLMLAATTVKTETQVLTFGFDSVVGFAPTTFVCPSTHKAGCTILLDVSAGIWAVSPSNVAQLFLDITGPGAPLDPNLVQNVSSNTGPYANAATFQFAKRQIPAGSKQTVNIYFQMGFSGGTATTGFRTATAQLYLN